MPKLLLAACLIPAALNAANGVDGAVVSEDQARAGFLFQVAQYVEWPEDGLPSPGMPFRFCVWRDDSLVSVLNRTVERKTLQNRAVEVVKLNELAKLSTCQVAYAGAASGSAVRELLRYWRYLPVLLIGEQDRFAAQGGVVNLRLRDGAVGFEINTAAAARARLNIRSQLLRFAQIVADEGGGK